ncbi:helix-turn-helix domain-containing protein [Streptomyces sp. NPDC058371]|uniref:helix-turn-helix domain-containing protein n=1 Tax=Streptomyces sp. NPDC058371 TaxID=3346463 RepID=UPI0036533BA7
MPTLEDLITERPELRLRFLDPAHARTHGGTRVMEVSVVPLAQAAVNPSVSPAAGSLALVTLVSELDTHGATVLAQLVRYLKQRRAAGLVFQSSGRLPHIPETVRVLAGQLELPLLSTAAGTEWAEVNGYLQQQRARFAERQVERLDGLLSSLPSQFANPKAIGSIADWLAEALDADVVVHSVERGIIAAAPDSRANLARAVIFATPDADMVEHSRRVQIHGTDDEAVLVVGSHRPFDDAAVSMIRHAVKLLGGCEQARQDHQAAVLAPRSARQAATQLLLTGQVVVGQVVANTVAPQLMDTPRLIVRIVDTGTQDREQFLRRCERTLQGKSLVSPCPGKEKQIIIMTPTREDERVEPDLRQMISSHKGLLMGESTPYALADSGAGYAEAAEAVRNAARSPERISVGTEPKFAPLLPRNEARAWAQALLAPLLAAPEHEQVLHSLPTGLSFKGAEAARGLGIHRNTLHHRLDRAANLLALDLTRLNDRVLVLLALNILALPAPQGGFTDVQAPELADLIAARSVEVKEWAEQRLRALESDPRDLLGTVRVWLEKNLSIGETAQALGLSTATVRSHKSAAEVLLGMDPTTKTISVKDTDVVSIADIYIASYLLTGSPELKHVAAAP